MRKAVDTSKTHEIGLDRTVIFYYLVVCLAIAAAGVWMIVAAPDSSKPGKMVVGGLVSAVGFGGMALLGIRRLIGERGPAITLSPRGLKVPVISPDFVPWTGIVAVDEWSLHKQRGIELMLDPATNAATKRTLTTRLFGGMSGFKRNSFVVSAAGTLTTHDELSALVDAYFLQFGPAERTEVATPST